MATREETDKIRALLQQQANQRVNPFMKGLSMLTGGIAGEFTGTNEDIRNRNYAKRALMEQDIDALKEERVLARTEAARVQALKDRIAENAAQAEARLIEETRKARGTEMVLKDEDMVGPLDPATMAGMASARSAQAKVNAERMNALKGKDTEMRGYLAGRGVKLGDPDVETTEFIYSQEKSKEALKKEQDTKMQLVTPSGSVVYGSYDQLAEKYPSLIENITVSKKEPKPLDASFSESGGEYQFRFGPGVTPSEAAKYKNDVYKEFGVQSDSDLSGKGGATTAKPLPKAPAATPGDPMVGRGSGKPRAGAAAVIANEVAAQPDMYGPPTPREQFRQTGRRLSELESRGGASAYGAPQTLTSPFNEAVASELNIQPERVGGESILVKEAKAVVASQFPTEQWNSLPQEVKNRIYIQALNESAAKMAKPPSPKSILGLGYAESPFAPYSVKRD
jgi:hypothetical protein